MILGVVSDTHNHVSNVERIIDIFNSKKVDKVIHTGDITQAKTLARFSRLGCSLLGVFGNNDLKEIGLKEISKINGFRLEFPPFVTKIGNRKIAILHEPDDIQDLIKENPSIDLILHGHTHRYRNETINGIKIFNPGECAGLQKDRNAIGLVNLKNLSLERIFF